MQCLYYTNGETATVPSESLSTNCNGKTFTCINPGLYLVCETDLENPNQTTANDSNAIACPSQRICDNNDDTPCATELTDTSPTVEESSPSVGNDVVENESTSVENTDISDSTGQSAVSESEPLTTTSNVSEETENQSSTTNNVDESPETSSQTESSSGENVDSTTSSANDNSNNSSNANEDESTSASNDEGSASTAQPEDNKAPTESNENAPNSTNVAEASTAADESTSTNNNEPEISDSTATTAENNVDDSTNAADNDSTSEPNQSVTTTSEPSTASQSPSDETTNGNDIESSSTDSTSQASTEDQNGNPSTPETESSSSSGDAELTTISNESTTSGSTTVISSTTEKDEDQNQSSSTENTSENSDESASSNSSESNSSDSSDDNSSLTSTTTVTPTPAKFICTAVGRFPHPTDCQKYIYCWDLVHDHVTFSCKPKEVFDPEFGRCSNDWSVCSAAPKCEENKQHFPDPSDEHSYFICKRHGDPLNPAYILHKNKCKKHHIFDIETLLCKLNETEIEIPSSEESNESIEKIKFKCVEEGIFPDLANESKYYECILKNVIKGKFKTGHRNCRKNHIFSLEEKLCIPDAAEEALDLQFSNNLQQK